MNDNELPVDGLTCRGVGKTFPGPSEPVRALPPVSFTLMRGKTLALVGPSGSGKTTLLSLLGGLDRPSEGQIVFAGRSYSDMSHTQLIAFRRREVGFVFQSGNLVGGFSLWDNIAMPLWLNGWHRREVKTRVDALVQRLGLEKLRRRMPSRLSAGEVQRTALGRALAHRPALLLADEPTGNLDHRRAKTVTDLLLELAQDEGCAVVVATHDLNLAAKFDGVLDLSSPEPDHD